MRLMYKAFEVGVREWRPNYHTVHVFGSSSKVTHIPKFSGFFSFQKMDTISLS